MKRVPKEWTFEKVLSVVAGLLRKGWKVRKGKPNGNELDWDTVQFKPPGRHRYCFCALEAIAHDLLGPSPDEDWWYKDAARELRISHTLEEKILRANDQGLEGYCSSTTNKRRVLFLLKLKLPIDPSWRNVPLPTSVQRRLHRLHVTKAS